MNWIPIEVGRGKRYTVDERIRNFPPADCFAPAGVLQSSSSVGPQLRVDHRVSSRGGVARRAKRYPGRRWRPSHNSAAGSCCGRDYCPRSEYASDNSSSSSRSGSLEQGCGSATRFSDYRTKMKINKNLLSPDHVAARRSRRYITLRNTKFVLRRLHEM